MGLGYRMWQMRRRDATLGRLRNVHREMHTVIRKAWGLLKTWIDLDRLEKMITTEHNYGRSKMHLSMKGAPDTSVAGGSCRQIASTLGLRFARPSPCAFIPFEHLVSKCKYLLGISLVIYESHFNLFSFKKKKKRIYWQKINRTHFLERRRPVQLCWTLTGYWKRRPRSSR